MTAAEENRANERWSRRQVEELFDRGNDGVAANRRFEEALCWHVAVSGDGTSRLSYAGVYSEMLKAERQIQRRRQGA